MIRVYFDSDGVLADFDKYYSQISGDQRKGKDRETDWKLIDNHENFFLKLPETEGIRELWDMVPAEERYILSAVPKSVPLGAEHKRQWLKEHFGIEGEKVVLVYGRKNKKKYAAPNHILIDDRTDNIEEWKQAGGVGILCDPDIVDEAIRSYKMMYTLLKFEGN